jgi:hypothetical protein
MGVKWHLHCNFGCQLPHDLWYWGSVHVLISPLYVFWWERSFAHFWIRFVGLLLLNFRSFFLHIRDINPITDTLFANISPIPFLFTLTAGIFFFSFSGSSIVCLCHLQEIKAKFNIMKLSFLLTFFIVSDLTFRSLVHCDLIFYMKLGKSPHAFKHEYSLFLETFVEKENLLSPLSNLATLIKKSFDYRCKGSFLGSLFYSVSLYVHLYTHHWLL